MFDSEVGEISVEELLAGGEVEFILPSYQRGYRWREKQVQALIDDFYEKWKNGGAGEYLLQPIVVCRVEDKSRMCFKVIDGQQRLRTLRELLNGRTGQRKLWSIRTDDMFDKERLTNACLRNCQRIVAAEDNEKKLKDIHLHLRDIKLIYYNISADAKWINCAGCEHKVFEDLNANKIGLTDSELIRALYLGGRPEAKACEIAAEWEQIENRLQNDSFWYMFNGEEPGTATRMDKLFSIITSTEGSHDKHPAYHKIEKDPPPSHSDNGEHHGVA